MKKLEDYCAMNCIQLVKEVGQVFLLINMTQTDYQMKLVMMKHIIIDSNQIMVLDFNYSS